MADKMMRTAGVYIDENGIGRARAIRTDKDSNLRVGVVGNIARTKTAYRAGVLAGRTSEVVFENLTKGNTETVITSMAFSFNADTPALSIRMFYGGAVAGEYGHRTINASGGGAQASEALYPTKLRDNVDQLFEVVIDDEEKGQYLYRLRYPISVKGLRIQVRNDSDISTHQVAITMTYSEVD